MAVGAIITAVATIAATAVNVGMQAKAAKERSKMPTTSPGEQSALDLQRMKVDDLAGMGGLSAGQYQRGLMQDDVFAQQSQQLVNKMGGASPFSDAFRKEAFSKLALSEVKAGIKRTAYELQDADATAAARNAMAAIQGAGDLAAGESRIVEREKQKFIDERNQKIALWNNMGKMIGSVAKTAGAVTKYGQERGWFDENTGMGVSADPMPTTLTDQSLYKPDIMTPAIPSKAIQGGMSEPKLGADFSLGEFELTSDLGLEYDSVYFPGY
jgi:hypothetical protein